jgi:hypothetical protein
MGNLNRSTFSIKFKQGLAADINSLVTRLSALLGEPHYTTDTKRIYIFDGSNNVRVHGLDLAVVNSGQVVTNAGQIVWSGEMT